MPFLRVSCDLKMKHYCGFAYELRLGAGCLRAFGVPLLHLHTNGSRRIRLSARGCGSAILAAATNTTACLECLTLPPTRHAVSLVERTGLSNASMCPIRVELLRVVNDLLRDFFELRSQRFSEQVRPAFLGSSGIPRSVFGS